MPLADSPHDKSDGPLIELYEFAWQGATLRLANFLGDETVEQDHWDYGGEEWLKYPVGLGQVRDAVGELPETTLTIGDPLRKVLEFLETNDPTDALCRIRVVNHAGLLLLELREVQVKHWIAREPARVDVILGSPDLAALYIPRDRIARDHCLQPWEFRHEHEHRPGCVFPSELFGLATRQRFFTPGAGGAARVEVKHGWHVEGATGGQTFADSGVSRSGQHVLDWSKGGFELNAKMRNTNLNALRIHKLVGDTGEDEELLVDLEARVELSPLSTYSEPMLGVYVMNANDSGDWVFVGFGSTVGKTIYRTTVDLVSTTTEFANAGYTAFRIRRVALGSWEFYARPEAYGVDVDESSAWVLVGTATTGQWSIVRCGVLLGADDDPPTGGTRAAAGWVYHVRYRRGGLRRCSRLLEGATGCQAHKNTYAFSGFRTAPLARHV